MPTDLTKAIQDAMNTQFQAGYAAGKMDLLLAAALPPPVPTVEATPETPAANAA